MKVIITGTTGLAKAIAGALANDHYVKTTRIEDIIDNHVTWWGFEQYDVLINNYNTQLIHAGVRLTRTTNVVGNGES